MKALRGVVGLAMICAIVVALSLAGIVSDFVAHLALNIDGIMLLLACLLMAGVFALMLLLIAKEQGWISRSRKNAPSAPSGAGN